MIDLGGGYRICNKVLPMVQVSPMEIISCLPLKLVYRVHVLKISLPMYRAYPNYTLISVSHTSSQ